MTNVEVPNNIPPRADDGWLYLLLAWCVALVSTLSVLFVGEVMGQVPCNLCWFQRTFMFPLAVVLAFGAFRSDVRAASYGLPLAIIGWLIAGFHSLLFVGVIPEEIQPCGAGPSCASADMSIAGLPLPLLSLAAFTLIAALLFAAMRTASR